MKVPKTIEETRTVLNGMDALLTATNWQRSAIVYAHTRDGVGGQPDQKAYRTENRTVGLLPREFAALGFNGLKNHETVRNYRNNWKEAIAQGKANPIKPGDEIVTPEMDWPPTGHEGANSYDAIAERPDRVAEVLKRATPETQASALKQLTEPEVAKGIIRQMPVKEQREVVTNLNDAVEATRPKPTEPVIHSDPEGFGNLDFEKLLSDDLMRACTLMEFLKDKAFSPADVELLADYADRVAAMYGHIARVIRGELVTIPPEDRPDTSQMSPTLRKQLQDMGVI